MLTYEVNLVLVLWALGLDVTWLAALVAGALRGGLGWAVTAQMTGLATVVALLALGAVAGHMSNAAAGVAGLLALTAVATVGLLAAVAAVVVTTGTGLWAVAGNVSDLGALVALLGGSTERAATLGTLSSWVGAVTGDVAWLTAYFVVRR